MLKAKCNEVMEYWNLKKNLKIEIESLNFIDPWRPLIPDFDKTYVSSEQIILVAYVLQ